MQLRVVHSSSEVESRSDLRRLIDATAGLVESLKKIEYEDFLRHIDARNCSLTLIFMHK